jgi:integrase
VRARTQNEPKPRLRARAQRIASGFVSRLRNPLDPSRRIRIWGPTLVDVARARGVVEGWITERALGTLSDRELARKLRAFDQRAAPRMIADAWREYEDAASPAHRRTLESVWKHMLATWFDGEPVWNANPHSMSAWETDMTNQGYAPKTIKRAFELLSSALRRFDVPELPWRLENGTGYWKPSRPARPVRESVACGDPVELVALINAAQAWDERDRARGHFADRAPRVAVISLSALRNGEASALGWDDVIMLDGAEPRLRIRHKAVDGWREDHPTWTRPIDTPKSKKARVVKLHPSAAAALRFQRAMLIDRGIWRADGPVFPAHEGYFTWRNGNRCVEARDMKRLAELAGLPDASEWTTHSLRHTAATLESVGGGDLRSTASRGGWANLHVLEGYTHARTGRALAPSSIPVLTGVSFGGGEGDGSCAAANEREARPDGAEGKDDET